jgi:hypothetical protein
MWQLMHWLVGIARVKLWVIGWPSSASEMVGSMVRVLPL